MKSFAIAATILIAAGAGLFTWHTGRQGGPGGSAFAEMVRPLLEASSAHFTITTQKPGRPPETTQGLFMAPNHSRLCLPDGKVMVVDPAQGRLMITDPAARTARLVHWGKPDGAPLQARPSIFTGIRELLRRETEKGGNIEALGQQDIAGVSAEGYRIRTGDRTVTVWADAATKLLLSVEMVGAGETATLTDISYNVPMDASQFAVTAPEGFTVTEEAAPLSLTVTGIVKDRATGAPVAGARVEDDKYGPKPYRGADSDSAGQYSFSTWPEEHGIIVTAPGYKPLRQTVSPRDNGKLTLDFALERE